jgi:hypothetical protein
MPPNAARNEIKRVCAFLLVFFSLAVKFITECQALYAFYGHENASLMQAIDVDCTSAILLSFFGFTRAALPRCI